MVLDSENSLAPHQNLSRNFVDIFKNCLGHVSKVSKKINKQLIYPSSRNFINFP